MKIIMLVTLIFSFSLMAQNVPVGGQLDITNKSSVKTKTLDKFFKKSVHQNWKACGLSGSAPDSLLSFYLQFKDLKMSVDPNIINQALNKKCHEANQENTDQTINALCIILDENVQKVLKELGRMKSDRKEYFEKEITQLKKKKDRPAELPDAQTVYDFFQNLRLNE